MSALDTQNVGCKIITCISGYLIGLVVNRFKLVFIHLTFTSMTLCSNPAYSNMHQKPTVL